MMHIPPGTMFEAEPKVTALRPEHNERLNQLLRQHSDVILGTYAAHLHYDTFRIIYNEGEANV